MADTMEVDAGVEEKKGEEQKVPATAASAPGKKGNNIMLHPVCANISLLLSVRLHSSACWLFLTPSPCLYVAVHG